MRVSMIVLAAYLSCTVIQAADLPFTVTPEICLNFEKGNPSSRVSVSELKIDNSLTTVFVYIEVNWSENDPQKRVSIPLYFAWKYFGEDGTIEDLTNYNSSKSSYVFTPRAWAQPSRWVVSQTFWLEEENLGTYEFYTFIMEAGNPIKIDTKTLKVIK